MGVAKALASLSIYTGSPEPSFLNNAIRTKISFAGSYELSIQCELMGTTLTFFPTSHSFCRMLSHMLMFFSCLYCKQYRPRSDCSQGSSLIRVHILCFFEKILSEEHLIICSRCKKQMPFSGKNIDRIRVKPFCNGNL